MKKTIILASVAIATLFAFSSCQKENLESNYSANGLRIITAEFENNATKTILNSDGITPEWEEGDVIRILNSLSYEDVTLAAGDITDNKITFNTNLQGDLYAVYPASATTLESFDGNVSFTIPAIQDGTFASANICVAKGDDRDNLTFRNATAMLKITTADEVVGVDITATNNIAGTVTASFSGDEISLTPSLTGKTVSAVGTTAPTGNVFYLAAAPVEATGDTKVNCYKTDLKGSEDKTSKELERNVIYSMDLSSMSIETASDLTGKRGMLNGHEYVIIRAKYDGTNYSYLKWATMNVGATAVTGTGCYGRYFMWGETTGIVPEGDSFDFPDTRYYSADNSTWDKNQCFVSNNCPWTNGVYYDIEGCKKVFTKYVPSAEASEFGKNDFSDDKTILDPEDDAASVNWGGTWRMPKGFGNVDTPGGDFKAMIAATYWCWDNTDKGYYVYAPQSGDAGKKNNEKDSGHTYDKSSALLFFPAAGYGNEWDPGILTDVGDKGYYWSRNLSSISVSAQYFLFEDYYLNPNPSHSRYNGLPIRPVSD